jgi:hypothetical protein
MIGGDMSFREDALTALGAGDDHHALIEVVRRHRERGLSVADVYEALEGIWLEHGFDKKEAEEGALQDALEFVMEKVWYGLPPVSQPGDAAACSELHDRMAQKRAERLKAQGDK